MTDFLPKVLQIFTTTTYLNSLLQGLLLTLEIATAATILGLIIGTIIALIQVSQKSPWLVIPKFIAKLYVAVIRGTPMALQLFIMFFVIFTFRGFPEVITAILAFGINSGAYVSEILRAGFLSVDKGQEEAGLALGLPHPVVFRKIILPQALKNSIPGIGNELIALIKETSIVSMVGMYDLTMAAKDIGAGNNLASYIAPMSVAALLYLAVVYIITFIIKRIEKGLRKSDLRQ